MEDVNGLRCSSSGPAPLRIILPRPLTSGRKYSGELLQTESLLCDRSGFFARSTDRRGALCVAAERKYVEAPAAEGKKARGEAPPEAEGWCSSLGEDRSEEASRKRARAKRHWIVRILRPEGKKGNDRAGYPPRRR